MSDRNRCDDITDLIDAALEDVLSTGGMQNPYDPLGDWDAVTRATDRLDALSDTYIDLGRITDQATISYSQFEQAWQVLNKVTDTDTVQTIRETAAEIAKASAAEARTRGPR
jgi:hypothetical protein